MKYVYKDIQELVTPVGFFAIYDGEQKIPFSVIHNSMDIPWKVYDNKDIVIGTIHTETNYQIMIKSKDMEIGKEYTIRFSCGEWGYCDSDEHTTCFCTVVGDWIVGIGAYDPNNCRKYDQKWAYSQKQGFLERGFYQIPPIYDEECFEEYTVEKTDDCNGYKFKLFDYKAEYIWFEAAWLQIKEFPSIEYEEALGLWLC